MEFVENELIPYAQLELIVPVRAGEQLFVDYGPTYAYSAHRFARYTGAGLDEYPRVVGLAPSATQMARHQQIEQNTAKDAGVGR